MKRKISLIVIAMLLLCMSRLVSVYAVPGEDAHSDSMTVEADGESVQEKQAAEQDVIDKEISEEELQVQLEEDNTNDVDTYPDENEDTKPPENFRRIRILLPAGIVILAAIIIGVATIRKKK